MGKKPEKAAATMKRYPVRIDEETHRLLRYLALDMRKTVEQAASEVFAEAVRRKLNEVQKQSRK